MASELVRRLVEANESSNQAVLGSDIFYKAAERINFLERQLEKIANPIGSLQAEAEGMGAKLNGAVAVELSKDPEYLKQLARAALRT